MDEVRSNVLVIGGGVTGFTAASFLEESGMNVVLVERRGSLGGRAANWACMATDRCGKCSVCLVEDGKRELQARAAVRVVTHADVRSVAGAKGDFTVDLEPVNSAPEEPGDSKDHALNAEMRVHCQAILLASGFEPYDPGENPLLGYGRFEEVVTLADVDHDLLENGLDAFLPESMESPEVAFIQCVGSRDPQAGRGYCSQFCCKASLRMMKRLKHLRPDLEITNFYIDLQIMGKEFRQYFAEMKERFTFIQGTPAEVLRPRRILPESDGESGTEESRRNVRLVYTDHRTGKIEEKRFDRIVLAIGQTPGESTKQLMERLELECNEFGYPAANGDGPALTSSRPGVYLAGACAGPADIPLSRLQAMAAAHRIRADLAGGE